FARQLNREGQALEDQLVGILPEEYRARKDDFEHCLRCQAELDPDRPMGYDMQQYYGPVSPRWCTRQCEVEASRRRYLYHRARPGADDEHVQAAGCIRVPNKTRK